MDAFRVLKKHSIWPLCDGVLDVGCFYHYPMLLKITNRHGRHNQPFGHIDLILKPITRTSNSTMCATEIVQYLAHSTRFSVSADKKVAVVFADDFCLIS